MLQIETITVGPFQSNCYILYNEQKQALVIDPGADADRIIATIEALDLTVVAYPTTHGHMDHVSALQAVHQHFPAPIGLHPLDASWAFSPSNARPPYYDTPKAPSSIERDWEHGQTWTDGGMTYRILFSPGHSPGGVCFLFEEEEILVSGDTLFQGAIGRYDLPGSNPEDLMKSLVQLRDLEGNFTVLPGHGPTTTLDHERATNPYLQ